MQEAEPFAPPGHRNLSPWYSWMVRLSTTQHVDPFPDDGDADDIVAWRARSGDRLEELLGGRPEQVDLDVEVRGSEECGSYRRDSIVFDTEASISVPAYLLVPNHRSEAGSAVLAIHGHGPGKSNVVGLTATEAPNGDYAHRMALEGHVVLAPDMRCFGERQDWNPPDHYACDTNLVHAVMAGECPLTQNLWDLGRCLDVLEEHPLVDPRKIAVGGLSYGGTLSLFLAATDNRVSAVVVSGYLSSWAAAHKMPWNMCGSQILPGMLGRLEHVDVAALVAPRPMLVETGRDDDLFPEESARETVSRLRRVYAAVGAPDDALVHDVFDGGHQWHGVEAYPFLDRWLR